ncbi:Auxin-responsive protein IAA13, putative isoform 1 [Hibiscus syriacus]|uniref:Auxin-responsive protein IAA13, putative isoform 1 n=1 Tax=Hibiscus syriacus TaxID=106335 RepID=A0A6A3D528_HIBSY|nr:uncharacterized protein LOC120208446 [Hibiscus syriacus]KAE8734988.1 Auxin-responsive protein IAA13, putative isoform 1 [Hibiscus syriacus]
MSVLPPLFHLLELNIISAQDLKPVCRRTMRTYAVAWVHSKRKLSTRIDTQGHTDPTWNDKFVFRVDDEFLNSETSTLMIEIYAVHWFRDVHVGSVRVIVKNLIPQVSPMHGRHGQEVQLGMSFVAFQVWRPSGRPQGILNIGLALLDNSMRSMPLYCQIGSSAVDYRHLMGEEDAFQSSNNLKILSSTKSNTNKNHLLINGPIKTELRRTKSDSSSILESYVKPRRSMRGSSVVNGGSIITGSEIGKHNYKVNSRGSSLVNHAFNKSSGIKMKPSSIVNGSNDRGAPKIWTNSEIGPSPSEVAATVARNMYRNKMEEAESSVGEGWSLDGSIEGLESKLERWQTELPPAHDQSIDMASLFSDEVPTKMTRRSRHSRKRAHKNKKGLFSCFGTICGCEISVTCG